MMGNDLRIVSSVPPLLQCFPILFLFLSVLDPLVFYLEYCNHFEGEDKSIGTCASARDVNIPFKSEQAAKSLLLVLKQ